MNYLKVFARDFKRETGINVRAFEENHYPHWKRLLLPGLSPNEINSIVEFVRWRFGSASNTAKLGTHNGQFCLTIDAKHLETAYNKNK